MAGRVAANAAAGLGSPGSVGRSAFSSRGRKPPPFRAAWAGPPKAATSVAPERWGRRDPSAGRNPWAGGPGATRPGWPEAPVALGTVGKPTFSMLRRVQPGLHQIPARMHEALAAARRP